MNTPTVSERRYDLDWLRLLAMLLIFVYHSTRPFDTLENWHVKNTQLTSAFNFMVIGVLWIMPLFFILAGAGSYFSLRSRGAWSFLRARFLRLAVPLMTLGWFVFGPLQVYIERVTGTGYNTSPFRGSFLDFIPHYFAGIYGQGGSFALHGIHLWFLFWLFLFSLLTLPFLMVLLDASGRRLIDALARMVEIPGMIFLFALPLCLVEVMIELGIGLDIEEAGWYVLTYSLLLVYGFLIVSDERFDRALQRHRWIALGMAVVLVAPIPFTGLPSAWTWWGPVRPIVDVLFLAIDGWCWLVAILGFGRRHLSFAHPSLQYAGEAVLPFYILHQPVIVLIAYIVRTWDLSIGLQYLIVSTTAFALIMLVYEFLVRRFNLLRFLFGMKLLPHVIQPHDRAAAPRGAAS